MTNTNLPQWRNQINKAYKKFETLNPEKAKTELGFAQQIFETNTYLQQCDPQSIFNAVVNVARTSITLNPVMRLAYLIPRKNKCVLEFSYMGLVAMLRDNNCIKSIQAVIVFEDEDFEYDIASNTITHKPKYAKTEEEHNAREMIGCYSRATLPNGEIVYEFMPMWEIDKIRRQSDGSSSKYSAWNTWRDEMIKKSVIKRHFKMLISGNPSDALATALQIENENHSLISIQKQKNNLLNSFNDVVAEQPIETIKIEESNNNYSSMSEDDIENILEEEKIKTEKNQIGFFDEEQNKTME